MPACQRVAKPAWQTSYALKNYLTWVFVDQKYFFKNSTGTLEALTPGLSNQIKIISQLHHVS